MARTKFGNPSQLRTPSFVAQSATALHVAIGDGLTTINLYPRLAALEAAATTGNLVADPDEEFGTIHLFSGKVTVRQSDCQVTATGAHEVAITYDLPECQADNTSVALVAEGEAAAVLAATTIGDNIVIALGLRLEGDIVTIDVLPSPAGAQQSTSADDGIGLSGSSRR